MLNTNIDGVTILMSVPASLVGLVPHTRPGTIYSYQVHESCFDPCASLVYSTKIYIMA